MIDSYKAQRLVGETIREVGILVFVFGPLDALYKTGPATSMSPLGWLALGLLFTASGIIIELRERRDRI